MNTDNSSPVVFISYSWDDEPHKEWVLRLANKLRENGINAFLDRHHLHTGTPFQSIIENGLNDAKKIIIIFTPNYKLKAENRKGGVGHEYSIISGDLYREQTNRKKIIPLLRRGTPDESLPSFMRHLLYADFTNDEFFETRFYELLEGILELPPEIGLPLGYLPTNLEEKMKRYREVLGFPINLPQLDVTEILAREEVKISGISKKENVNTDILDDAFKKMLKPIDGDKEQEKVRGIAENGVDGKEIEPIHINKDEKVLKEKPEKNFKDRYKQEDVTPSTIPIIKRIEARDNQDEKQRYLKSVQPTNIISPKLTDNISVASTVSKLKLVPLIVIVGLIVGVLVLNSFPKSKTENTSSNHSEINNSTMDIFSSYYNDLNTRKFDAFKYFADTVERYITMFNTTPYSINKYVSNGFYKEFSNFNGAVEVGSDSITKNGQGESIVYYTEIGSCFRASAKRNWKFRCKVMAVLNSNNKITFFRQYKIIESSFY